MIPHDTHFQIGSLLFEGLDQIDLTGFEILSRIPNSTYRIFGKTAEPVRDVRGLRHASLADAPQLDLLHVPGGFGAGATDDLCYYWDQNDKTRAHAGFARCLSNSSPVAKVAGLLDHDGGVGVIWQSGHAFLQRKEEHCRNDSPDGRSGQSLR